MSHWNLDSIQWDKFQPHLVDPAVLASVKAAAMVEYNSADYVEYLLNIFGRDSHIVGLIEQWGEEERLHGIALGTWAMKADPMFSFEEAVQTFKEGYQIPINVDHSVRGSLAGELVSRCVIESGTSSFYKAMQEGVQEPVLQQIAGFIAADEFRHYKLFYDLLQKYLQRQPLSTFGRLKVALKRVAEAEDDELAYAYFSANLKQTGKPYFRSHCWKAYQASTLTFYRKKHVGRLISMVLKASGLSPHGLLSRCLSVLLWWGLMLQRRTLKTSL